MFHKNNLFHTSLSFDLRAPFETSSSKIFAAALEMATYADAHGLDEIALHEHHGSEDGYLPTPFLMGSAMAAVTKRIAIVLGAIILPLHDPVKIAEMIGVADLISDGRIHVVLAAGYAEREFKAFGVSIHDRARLMEEGFDIILRALAGERFEHNGREVFVRPLPARPAVEVVFGGGGAAASARRAARFGLGLMPMNEGIIAAYEQERQKQGRRPGRIIQLPTTVHLCDDPEAAWAELAPYLLHWFRAYAALSSALDVSASPLHGLTSMEAVRASGMIQMVTPDEAVEIGMAGPIGLMPLVGGLKPELGWKSLELFATKVVPRIKGAGDAIRAEGPEVTHGLA